MPDVDTAPIVVTDSALPGQLGTTLRQGVLLLTGWATGKGYLDANTAGMLVTLVPLVATVAWGQYAQWRSHRDKRALAISAPIGTVK